MHNTDLLDRLAVAVENLDQRGVVPLVEDALAGGLTPSEVLSEGLSRGMQRVGAMFQSGEMFMPEVLVACDVYFAGLELVKPLLPQDEDSGRIGTMVIGSIHGDVHTVGKEVAVPVFEASNIRVVDLGVSVDDEDFVAAIRQHQPQIVGLGTYMTSTFMHTGQTVAAIERAGLRPQVKIICGGPAVDADAARRMGADGATNSAWKGVELIKEMLSEETS